MENQVHHIAEVLSEPAAMKCRRVPWSGRCLGPLENHVLSAIGPKWWHKCGASAARVGGCVLGGFRVAHPG